MPTTTNILLSVPAHGTQVDVWDTNPINDNSAILDAVAGSVTTKSVSNVNITLSTTESRVSILRFTGSLTGNIIVTLGAVIKSWICENNATGFSFSLKIQGSTGTGNVVALPPGSSQIYWDGTNVSFVNLYSVGQFIDLASTSSNAWIAACTVPPLLLCDGSTFNASTYPLLNHFLGGNTLPDARGRSRIPLDGGTGRVTTAGSGIDGTSKFAAGGAQNQTILQANFPSVNFNLSINDTRTWRTTNLIYGAGSVLGFVAGSNLGLTPIQQPVELTGAGTIGGTAASGGSGTALVTMPPTYIGGLTYIRAA